MIPKEVVVILPSIRGKVLMQLRDAKEGIVFPGCWGFFGGAMNEGETPEDTAKRELLKELEYNPGAIHKLNTERRVDLGDIVSHSFYCPLTEAPQRIRLKEGMDLGLFSLEEVVSKKLYSNKFGRLFPVAASVYIPNTIRMLMRRLGKSGD